MILLILPAAVAGFICGMLFMRANYMRLLREARINTSRVLRYSETRANQERLIGYAVGYREGNKK